MEKTILLILISILTGNLMLKAQTRFPIKNTSVWRINYEFPRYEWTKHASGDEEYKYFIGGDTIISGKNYFKLLKSGILFLESPLIITNKYVGAIRDSENKFYYVEKNSQTEKLLYDFDAIVGSSMPDKGGALRQVSAIEMLAGGRKKFTFNFITVHCGSANTVVEGIGWLGGLLEGNSCSGHPGVRGSYLVCYSEDGMAKYESPTAINIGLPCADPNTSVPGNLKQDLKFLMSHSTISVSSPDNSSKMEYAEIYNILGNKILEKKVNLSHELIIDIAFLESGMYLLKISCNRQPYIFKFIKN